jgi:hypothetical protein
VPDVGARSQVAEETLPAKPDLASAPFPNGALGRERGPVVVQLPGHRCQEHRIDMRRPAGGDAANRDPVGNGDASLATTTRTLDILEHGT